MKKCYKQLISQLFEFKRRLQSLCFFFFIVIFISSINSCNKACEGCGNAPLGNLSAILIGYKWQLSSATNYDNNGQIINVYKGTAADSLFFDWKPDSNFNVTATNVETFVGGNYAMFGYTLKQIIEATYDGNFIICAQPWKAGYSDTVRILPLLDLKHQHYILFKIGKPYDSATKGYEIDSLSMNGENDR